MGPTLSIKQKLLLMGAMMAILVVSICGIGYYKAQTALTESIAGEIDALLHVEAENLDAWSSRKIQRTESAANLVSALDGNPVEMEREVMSLAAGDKDVIDLAYGAEDARFISWSDGNLTGEFNPLDRPWYRDAKAAGKTIITPAYQDAISKKMVVSVAAPYYHKNGAFAGAVCSDLTLDTLGERVAHLKYHGEGAGIIVDPSGLIIASTEGLAMHRADENPVLREHLPEMRENKNGYFATEKDGEQQIIAYATVPSSGWIVGIAVPESIAFAQLAALKVTYTGLTILGILLVAVLPVLLALGLFLVCYTAWIFFEKGLPTENAYGAPPVQEPLPSVYTMFFTTQGAITRDDFLFRTLLLLAVVGTLLPTALQFTLLPHASILVMAELVPPGMDFYAFLLITSLYPLAAVPLVVRRLKTIGARAVEAVPAFAMLLPIPIIILPIAKFFGLLDRADDGAALDELLPLLEIAADDMSIACAALCLLCTFISIAYIMRLLQK